MWYTFLNYFFFGFHSLLILFNSLGWLFPKLRKWNLITLLATAFSWFVLGIWYGWGYCLCTDWHWQVRKQLGYSDESDSYVHFLLLKLTGVNFSPLLVDRITVVVFFVSLILSVWLNQRDYRRGRRKKY
jgi:Protein of Unknown function (DUF2784)